MSACVGLCVDLCVKEGRWEGGGDGGGEVTECVIAIFNVSENMRASFYTMSFEYDSCVYECVSLYT